MSVSSCDSRWSPSVGGAGVPAFSMTTLVMSQEDVQCTKGAGLPHNFRMSCGRLASQKHISYRPLITSTKKSNCIRSDYLYIGRSFKKKVALFLSASCSLDIAGSPQTAIMVHLLLVLNAAFISCIHGIPLLPSFPTRGEWFSSFFFGTTVSTLAVRLRKC